MNNISRRLGRLEYRLTPRVDTVFAQRIRNRLEQGRRRVRQAQERGEYEPPAHGLDGFPRSRPRSLIEILHAGRERARLQAVGEEEQALEGERDA